MKIIALPSFNENLFRIKISNRKMNSLLKKKNKYDWEIIVLFLYKKRKKTVIFKKTWNGKIQKNMIYILKPVYLL